jgi:hypothetical protein
VANWRRYYAAHRTEILKKRRRRYRTDLQYREECQTAARERQQKKGEGEDVPKLRDRVVQIGGREIVLRSIGVLAGALGVHPETIKLWEQDRIIPVATLIDDAGRRWYTDEAIAKLTEAHVAWKTLGDGRLATLQKLLEERTEACT